LLLIALMGPSLAGCGCTEDEAPAVAAPVEEPKPRWLIEQEKAEAAAAAGATPATATAMADETPDEDESAPPPVPVLRWSERRTDEVSQWKPQDYLDAMAEDDPRLLEAIVAFGKATAGDEKAAELLAQLLAESQGLFASKRQTVVENPDDEEEREQVRINIELGKALVGALAANGTPPARKMLQQVLQGKLKSDFDDRTLTSAALEALAGHLTLEHENVLYVVLTSPAKVRPPNRGHVSANA
jgi:hypothetical protein